MIKKIVVDGNDGTGKTYRIKLLEKLFPGVEIKDRGLFSEYTLKEEYFKGNISKKTKEVITAKLNFKHIVSSHKDTLFIILDASPETCQKRISERGDSLEQEYHNMKDLKKYRKRFKRLVKYCDSLNNVIMINTDNDI